MAVPPTESWTSRAKMPLVSVTMAWASETPGVRTPPTVVKAPYFRTCLRLSGLAMSPSLGPGGLAWRMIPRDLTVVPTTHEAPTFRVQSHEPARSGRRHLRPRRRAAPHAVFAFLSVSDLITKTEAQFAAFMAVIIACLGFVVFRRLVDQIARLAREVNLPILADEPLPDATQPGRVPALGQVAEIGQLAGAFHQMLED